MDHWLFSLFAGHLTGRLLAGKNGIDSDDDMEGFHVYRIRETRQMEL